jgi:hypothetical protein
MALLTMHTHIYAGSALRTGAVHGGVYGVVAGHTGIRPCGHRAGLGCGIAASDPSGDVCGQHAGLHQLRAASPWHPGAWGHSTRFPIAPSIPHESGGPCDNDAYLAPSPVYQLHTGNMQVLLYFVVLPTTPLLLTLAACGGRTACLSSEWRGAVWAVGVCVPLGVGAWMVLGSLAHVQRFGFTTMLFVTSTLCGLIMVPVGVILPLWALSTWESFPQFARSDALVTCGVALAVGSTAINFKVAFGLRPKPTMPLITKRVYLALVLVLWLNSCGLQIHALVALRLALMSNRALLLVVTGTLLFLGPATTFACGLPQVSLPSKLNVLVWLGMVVPVTVGLWVPAHGEIHAETRGLLQGVVPFAGGVLCTASAFSNFVGDGACSRDEAST